MIEDRSWSEVDEPLASGERSPRSAASAPSPTVLSTREAAAALGVCEQTIRRAISRGDLAASRRGRAFRIRNEDVIRYGRRAAQSDVAKPRARIVAFPVPADAVSSLPAPGSSFVGRDAELAALVALLADPAMRLVTLTGPGGRRQDAARAGGGDGDAGPLCGRRSLCGFCGNDKAELVIPTIGQTLGLRERPGQDRHAQLATFLRPKRLLLVLDNFEQLVEAAPDVARLLARAPGVTALVTSRAPLRVAAEHVRPAPPLALAGAGATPEELLASEAGRLFVERALAHDPGFTVDAETAPVIADICARLDGLPLAIELAAAQAKVLPPRHLRQRLERRLPPLTRGARDAPARQGAMRDAIARSYGLLTSEEQRLFRRLAVFAGGFSLEAADEIGSRTSEVESCSLVRTSDFVFEVVASLVDQSLVVRDLGPDGEPRFRMLETIREYGLERLEAGEEIEARAAHARFYFQLAQTLRPWSNTQVTRGPHDRLAADDANVRAALDWLEAHGRFAEVATIVASCWVYWYAIGRLREGDRWLTRALDQIDEASAPDRARLLVAHAELLMVKGDAAGAEAAFARALPAARAAGAPLDLALALISCGAALNHGGKYADAEPYLLEALALAETIADPALQAAVAGRAQSNLSGSARGQGQMALAAKRSEEALRRYRGHQFGLAEPRTLVDLADIANDQGNHERAVRWCQASLAHVGEQSEMRLVAAAFAGIAHAAAASAQYHAALLLFGAADAVRERAGVGMVMPIEAALLSRDLAALRDAVGEWEAATILANGRELPLVEAVAVAAAVAVPGKIRPTTPDGGAPALTRRERQVWELVAAGKSDREIAEALFLSPRTVSWHVRSILAKLGSASRREAVARARVQGLLPS